jgi:hypothetical protein
MIDLSLSGLIEVYLLMLIIRLKLVNSGGTIFHHKIKYYKIVRIRLETHWRAAD